MKNSLTLISIFWLILSLTTAVAQEKPDTKKGEAWEQQVRDSLGATFGDLTRREIGKDGSRAQGDDDNTDGADSSQDVDGTTVTGDTGAGGGPVDPAGLDPANPDISALIRQWISIAKPPINVQGANAHYTQWGTLAGQMIGGRSVQNSRPDAAAGMSSEVYAWSQRDRLDSIDHCKLAEYVMSQINEAGIENCRGRYKKVSGVTVRDVVGINRDKARQMLEAQGLKVQTKSGGPAPSAAKAFIVTKQDKMAVHVAPGSIITLTAYGDFNGDRIQQSETVTMPVVTGLPAAQAKKTLEALGLKVSLLMGTPAISKEQAYKVVRQDHGGGTQVAPGTIVKLTLYDEYKTPITIPALAGLPGAVARSQLLAAGFTVEQKSVGKAPDASNAFTVRDTIPAAKTVVAKGSLVVINTYAAFDDSVVMPNIIGMNRREAQLKLDSLGINIRTKESGEPPRQQQQYLVTAQSPAEGAKIRPNMRAEITHYGAYVWRRVMPDLRGLSRDMVSASFSDGKIIITSVWGDTAPTNAKSETVASQSISPGIQIKEGTSLRLVYFRKSRDHQLAAFNCKIPNSVRYWNAAKSVPGCQCRQGFSPSQDGKKCIKNKTREQLVAEFRCTVPNSQSYWNQSTGRPACQCRQGFSPSRDGKNCLAARPVVPTVRNQPQIKPQVVKPQIQRLPPPPPHIASQGFSCEKLRKMGYSCPVRNCLYGVIGDDCDL